MTAQRESRIRSLAETSLVVVLLLPCLAGWSWAAGVVDLLTLGSERVVMGPGEAALLLLAGALALFGRGAIWSDDPRAVKVLQAAAGFLGCAGVLAALRRVLDWEAPLEQWLVGAFRVGDGRPGVPPEVTSPWTGGALVVVAWALGTRYRRRGDALPSRVERVVGAGLAVAGLVFAAWHAVGGGPMAPMALWSAWGLLFLGFGMWGTTAGVTATRRGRREPVFRGFQLHPGAGVPLVLTVAVAGVIAGLGAVYLRHEQGATRMARQNELQAIADLKVQQIRDWRQERLGDARFFANAPFVQRDVAAVRRAPGPLPAREEMLRWMELLKAGDRYASVRVYDEAWRMLASVPVAPGGTQPVFRDAFAAELPRTGVWMSDLYRPGGNGEARMELAGLLRPPGSEGTTNAPMGYLVMELNPERFLFPLLRSWPTPTRTAETVLVRAEGGEAVYLNQVQRGSGAAVTRRLPLDPKSPQPAVRAALGMEGVMEGVDDQGEPVLAAARRVADTGWCLVAKVERREIYAVLQGHAWMTLGWVVGLSGITGLGIGMYTLRRERELERQRASLAERLALLMRQANDVVLVLDREGRIVDANHRAEVAYGMTESELKTRCLRDLVASEAERSSARADEDGCREALHRRRDGSTFPVELSQHTAELEGTVYRQVIIRDIAERKEQEARLRRTNRALRTLTETNQALVRLGDEARLVEAVCRLMVEVGGYRMAWVGYAEETEEGGIRPVARAGHDDGYVEQIRATWRAGERGQGPSGSAIRARQVCVFRDLRNDPRFGPWREEALKRGYASSIALPLTEGGRVFGVLRIYSDRTDAFDPEEEGMLVELAADLAFGIQALRVRAERDRVTDSLRRREELFRCLFESHVVGVLVADVAGTIREANDTFLVMIGRSRSELPLSGRTLTPPEWQAHDADLAARLQRGEEPPPTEKEFYRKDGRRVPVLLGLAPIPSSTGSVVGFVLDITGRKQTEERLWVESARLASLSANVPAIIFQMAVRPDGTMTCLYISDACSDILGIPPSEAQADVRTLLDLPHPEEKAGFDAVLEQAIGAQGPWRWAGRAMGRRGMRWVEGEAIPHALSDGTMVWDGVIVDVTARRQADEALRAGEERSRQQQKLESIGTLASGVAHEINNPINGVMNYAQLILDDAQPGTPTAEYAGEILEETGRVADIVRHLLQFARQERRGKEPVRMQDLVASTLALIRTVMRHDHIELEVEVPPDLPVLRCRSQQIKQVLMNLLTNARDALNEKRATAGEAKRIVIRGSLLSRPDRRWVRLTVEDNGTGIPAGIRERIFDPFFTTKPRERGTGLGLAISHGLVLEHRGQLHFETEPGAGTRFHMDLPVREESEEDEPGPEVLGPGPLTDPEAEVLGEPGTEIR